MKPVCIAITLYAVCQPEVVFGFITPTVSIAPSARINNHQVKVESRVVDEKSPSSSSALAFFNRKVPEPEPVAVIIQGVGEEGCALPSPSGVNTLPEPLQALVVLGIVAALGVSSAAFSGFLEDITMKYEWVQTWRYTWPLLGAIYVAAGATHFTLQDAYENIFPSPKAWGIWYLPGSPEFHVKWTGVAEALGGLGLCIGGALDAFAPVSFTSPNILSEAGILSDSAAALLILTVAITPANIFMYTHGAKLPIEGPEVPVVGHAIRGIFQVIVIGLLYQMGQGTFDALLSS
eukprot:CAMPEP_0197833018 /NCGR_PEP_ID=MMETSP1437-20131217/17290_1 /TAXON_ID=49252 ORGANISM="Eucampia antarctica, Strain CCMP1452" /NCGR_SAMPLE_ID=MMETSP1437 /ASSEMBLY_ACC=CAM_ASM_001096 /LENGTH=290 /DNA_ID=CAMNT_0043436747 /DNA_START=19 /DNA_END=891 /DNA_ORIENTATION=+